MTNTVLVTARIGGPPSSDFLDIMRSEYEDLDIVLYLFGDKSKKTHGSGPADSADKLIYDHDLDKNLPSDPNIEYLSKFEETLENNIWRAVAADRRLSKEGVAGLYHDKKSNYERIELLRRLEARVKKLDELFVKHSFDFVFNQHIMYLGGTLTALIAKRDGIRSFRIATTRIGDNYTVLQGLKERDPQIVNTFQATDPKVELPTERARDFISEVRDGGPLYTTPQTDRLQGVGISYRSILKFMLNPKKYIFSQYYYHVPAAKMIYKKLAKQIRSRWYSFRRNFNKFDPTCEYVYFPLQVQPELALMIRSPFHTNIQSVIQNVARSLPVGKELYINEHPEMVGVRSSNFYRTMQNIPNVQVLSQSVDTTDVVANAEVTVCINSSAGLLSLIHDTPTVTLSKPSYSILDSVQCPDSWESVYPAVKQAIECGVDREELNRFVAANIYWGVSHNRPMDEYQSLLCRRIRYSVGEYSQQSWID